MITLIAPLSWLKLPALNYHEQNDERFKGDFMFQFPERSAFPRRLLLII